MGRPSIFQFIYGQFRRLPEVKTFKADLTGKTVVITGANVGLGYEAAKHLARMSPGRLILACRSMDKGNAAVAAIKKETGCTTIECWALDLGSFESVKAFADSFAKEGGNKLDILIENAGVFAGKYEKTVDSWESTLEVNHLGTCLLALRLLPYLLRAPSPRLAVVSSNLHYFASLKGLNSANLLTTLNDEAYVTASGAMFMQYNVSKLLNVLFTRGLVSRLKPTSPLTANAVNPGLCKSSLTRSNSNFFTSLLTNLVARTTEVGSRTLVHAAVAKNMDGVSGQYLDVCEVHEPADLALRKDVEDRVWNETVEVLGEQDPTVLSIIRACLVADRAQGQKTF